MIFSRAELGSLQLIRQALTDFERVSGLAMHSAKSRVFFSGLPETELSSLQSVMGFPIGSLPVRYLGVPLITTRLRHSDCLPLVERILSRIRLWTSASLTYAGRLQLIRSVLFSIQVYWSGMFILPASITRRIESILSAFLWRGTSLSHTGAKVSWESVCYPRREGGLGIRRVRDWNRAATLKYVWRLFADRSSTWVTWVHAVLLRGRSFWHIRIPSSSSWVWRKILQSRQWCRGLIVACIGDGRDTSLWQDYWLPDQGPLCDSFSFRDLSSTGLSWDARVSVIIQSGEWVFPTGSHQLQRVWDSIQFRPRARHSDSWVWRGHPSGVFSVDSAWQLLRARRPEDPLHHLLWYPGHVPRHSFILWLASQGRLWTMDRLQQFGLLASSTCVLCDSFPESHDHLFFQCRYSSQVWSSLSVQTLSSWPSLPWSSLLQWASQSFRSRRAFRHLLPRLVLSATVYYLWYERNNRVFSSRSRPSQELIMDVFTLIRSRLLSLEPRLQLSEPQRHLWRLPS